MIAEAEGMGQEGWSLSAPGSCLFPFSRSGAGVGVFRAPLEGGERGMAAAYTEGPWALR